MAKNANKIKKTMSLSDYNKMVDAREEKSAAANTVESVIPDDPKIKKVVTADGDFFMTRDVESVFGDNKSFAVIVERGKDLYTESQKNYFTLGGVLSKIDMDKLYIDTYRTFKEFCSKEMGIEYRKARYLVGIYNKFSRLNIDETIITRYGWSALKEITKVVTDDNLDKLLDIVDKNTVEDIKNIIKRDYVSAEDLENDGRRNEFERTRFTFSAIESDASIIKNALEIASSKDNLTSFDQAWIAICAEYLQMNSDPEEVTLDDSVRMLEARYDVTLTVESNVVGESKEEVKVTPKKRRLVKRK